MATVDIAEERRAHVVPEELLESHRQVPRLCRRHREDVVLDGAQPRRAVVEYDAESALRRPVRSPTVPDLTRVHERVPAGISTVTVGVVASGRSSSAQRWLPGTIRVAPFASVKACSGHITFTTSSGWGRGTG